MNHLWATIPLKAKPLVLGAVVGIPAGLYLLLHKGKPNTGGSSTGRFSYRGTGIPVGGPEHTVTRNIYRTNNYTKYIPRTDRAKRWGHYNFLLGLRKQLRAAEQNERRWLAKYLSHPHRQFDQRRAREIEARLRMQNQRIGQVNRELKRAWHKAAGR